MFLPYDYITCNTPSSLRPGVYYGLCTVYSDPDDNAYFVREFRLDAAKDPSFVELLVRLNNGQLVINDYLLLDNMRWRDSNGTISSYLSDLLPAELEIAERVMAFPIKDKQHEVNSHG